MTDTVVFALIGFLASAGTVLWVCSAALITVARVAGREPSDMVWTVYHELRPFALTFILVNGLMMTLLDVDPVMYFFKGVELLTWLLSRDLGDDDRWRRRRQRLAEKVAVVSGQLRVVPAGAS